MSAGYAVTDAGCDSAQSVNYPDFAATVSQKIRDGGADRGVLICGSGQGMAMAANRFQGIRAGLAWNTEVARLIRSHNNAQVICFGARFTADEYAWQMLQAFLEADFEGGKHALRVGMIDQFC